MIPNTPPDGQVGVIPGTVGVACPAVAQLLGRDAVVVRFPAGSGWSVQALLDQRASLTHRCLSQARSLSESETFQERQVPRGARRNLLRVVGLLVAGFCVRFIWNLPPLEVDPVRKDGVGVEVRVDGVFVICLEETSTNLRSDVRVLREDSYRHDRLSCIL